MCFEAHHGCVWYYVRSRIRCTHQDEVKWAKKLHHQRPFPSGKTSQFQSLDSLDCIKALSLLPHQFHCQEINRLNSLWGVSPSKHLRHSPLSGTAVNLQLKEVRYILTASIKMRAIATNLYIWRVSQLFREVFLPWKFCLDEYLESLHCRPCSRVVLNSVNFFVCN